MSRKGIILAGGSGTRLHPLTLVISKQLLPIYDKPMIYYPLSILMLADIKDILIISTPEDTGRFESLLGDGSKLGINLSYQIQDSPDGLAQAFILGEKFIGNNPSTLILGDNIFYGPGLVKLLCHANKKITGASLFAYKVHDPGRYGVVEFNTQGHVLSIEEKPFVPKSDYAVTGLYFYDEQAVDMAKSLKPSHRGELEITDLNRLYLEQDNLDVEIMSNQFSWLDTGTHDSLHEATNFVHTTERDSLRKIACLEEIAWQKNWITDTELEKQAHFLKKNSYGQYLLNLLKGK